MSARLRGVARATERIVAAGLYRAPADGREVHLAAAIGAAREGTRTYGPEPPRVPHSAFRPAGDRIEVTGESSLEAARRLAADRYGSPGGPAGPDFASARNPGEDTSRGPRPRKRRCAAPPPCTSACCGRPGSTTTTGATATRSAPTG